MGTVIHKKYDNVESLIIISDSELIELKSSLIKLLQYLRELDFHRDKNIVSLTAKIWSAIDGFTEGDWITSSDHWNEESDSDWF